jgi:FMN phosphatase YigB (HAD superfamily)
MAIKGIIFDFDDTLAVVRASAEKAIIVGNDLDSDIKGAREVGIKTLWLNRNKKRMKAI